MINPIVLWYKKTLKSSGKPIVVQQGKGKNLIEYRVDNFNLDNCRIEMSFNNSVGSPKQAGATTTLNVFPNDGKTISEICNECDRFWKLVQNEECPKCNKAVIEFEKPQKDTPQGSLRCPNCSIGMIIEKTKKKQGVKA